MKQILIKTSYAALRLSALLLVCLATHGYFARFATAEEKQEEEGTGGLDFEQMMSSAGESKAGAGKEYGGPVLSGDANLLYIQGRQRVLDGRYEEALPFMEGAWKADPENAFVNYQLGEIHLRLGNIERAEALVRKAIEKEPKNPEYRSTLGWIYASAKRYAKSKEQFRKVLEIEPTNPKAPLLLGIVEVESGNAEEGIKVLSRIIDKNSDNLMAYFYRAKVYIELENFKQAKADLEKCLSIRPSFVEAGTTLGLLLEKQGELDEAVKIYSRIQGNGRFRKRLAQIYLQKNEYEKALNELVEFEKVEPDDYTSRLKIGLIHFELKQYDQAASRFESILKEQPEAENVRFYLAAVYEDQKKYDKAIFEFRKVTKDSTFYKEAMLHVGFILKEQGKIKDGLEHAKRLNAQLPEVVEFYDMHASFFESMREFKKALGVVATGLKRFPADERLLYFEGALLDKVGERQKGMANMRKILAANPNNAHALNFLGYTLAELGDNLDEAEAMVRKAISLRPNDGYIEDSLGWVLFKKGKLNEALTSLERAASLQPEEAVIFEHLGDVYERLQQNAKALEMYRKAVQLASTKDKDLSKKVEKKLVALQKEKRLPSNDTSSPAEVARPGTKAPTDIR